MTSNPEIYIGDIAKDYNFDDDAVVSRRVSLDRDFWRDVDSGEYLLFRRQRMLGEVSNVRPDARASAGFFGHRLGAANKEHGLAWASGHLDSVKFPYNVMYQLDREHSEKVVDLRHPGVAPLSVVALSTLSTTVGPIFGTSKFDQHPAVKDRPIITGRPALQRLLAPDMGRQAEEQPAAFMHVPYSQRLALKALGNRRIFKK